MKVSEISEDEWVNRWPQVRLDQFKNIGQMETAQMNALNSLCHDTNQKYGWTHRINSDFRPGDPGEHGKGEATDIVFFLNKLGDVPILEQFKFTCESNLFRRVGFYPFWNAPGLHVDIKNQTLYWYRDKAEIYHYKTDWREFVIS